MSVSRELESMLSRCAVCRSWAEQDEGPYYRDAQPERRDVVEDREGLALQLGIRLIRDDGSPAQDSTVEIWQCDALGRYSGFPPPQPATVVSADTAPRGSYLADHTFLRGRQRTDAAGIVEFRTVYPGWYPGRTVHIHMIVRAEEKVFTSQLYFPDDRTDEVYESAPYADRSRRDTTNATDAIFPTGGDPAVLDIVLARDGGRAAICLVLPGRKDSQKRSDQTVQPT